MEDPNQSTDQGLETSKSSRTLSVNRVTLVGRMVATPQLQVTPSGTHVTTVQVATTYHGHSEFHYVVLWRQMADFASVYVTKGRLVYVEGHLHSRKWEGPDGVQRRRFEIVADRFLAIGSRAGDSPTDHEENEHYSD